MKKALIILLLFISVASYAQRPFVVFGNVPENIFKGEPTADRTFLSEGTFLWSLDAVVSGAEITFNKEKSLFETSFLSGVGGAVGYKHYKPLADGTPVSNWGVSGALLTKVKLNDVIRTGIEIAVLANVYNFTAGPVYIFSDKKLGLLVGANISF